MRYSRAKNFEVLFLYDPWDEFVMENLTEFEGKKVVAAERSELKVDAPQEHEGVTPLTDDQCKDIGSWLKDKLGDQITEVRPSTRLTESPAVVLLADKMTAGMKRMMEAAGAPGQPEKYEFEINPRHPDHPPV